MAGIDQKALAVSVGRAHARQRVRSGLTQDEVAERLGVGNEAITRIEQGAVIHNIARLYDFVAIFSCEASDLLSEGCPRANDQGHRLSRLIEDLDEADRKLVVG